MTFHWNFCLSWSPTRTTPYHSTPGCWYCLWGACQKHLGPGFASFEGKNDPKSHPVVGFTNSVIFKMHLQFDWIIIDIIDGDLSNHWMQPWWQEKQQQMRTSPRKHGSIGLGLDPMMLLEQKKRGRRHEKWPLKGGEIICNRSTVMRKNIHRIGIIANPSSCQCHLKVTTAWVSEFLPKRWA